MTAIQEETWRPIPGYLGYEVTPTGRVRSWVARNGVPLPHGLKPSLHSTGRFVVSLRDHATGKYRPRRIHRLVALAFLGECPEGMEVRHLDGDPTNNHLSNLRYGTKAENSADSIGHGTHSQASKVSCPAGHPYTPANTYVRPSTGYRECEACRVQRRAARGRK